MDVDWLEDRHGCPAYVSPEILDASCRRYSGKAADIWSLGVLLFVLLFGRYPFYASTPAGLFTKIRHEALTIPGQTNVSYEVKALIHGLLRKAAVERPTARELLAVPWLQSREQPQSSVSPWLDQRATQHRLLLHQHTKKEARQEEGDHVVPVWNG